MTFIGGYCLKRFFKSQDGSVSVFLIIIFTAIFFFNAVLIDYARVMAAKKETDRAVNASLRSVLSAYDTELYKKYGLFGLSGSNEEAIFIETMKMNLENYNEDINFTNTTFDEETLNLTAGHQLGYHSVFERQILEDMKYSAPIIITEDLLDKYNSFSNVMDEAATTTEVLKDVNDLYEERQALLNEALELQKESADITDNLSDFNELENIINSYDGYISDLKEYEAISKLPITEENEKKLKQLRASINNYKKQAKTAESVYNSYRNSDHQTNMQKAENNIVKAKKINDEMRQIIEKAKINTNANGQTPEFKELTNNLDELILDDSFFQKFEGEIEQQRELYSAIFTNLGDLKSAVSSAVNVGHSVSSAEVSRIKARMRESLSATKNAKEDYLSSYNRRNGSFSAREEELEKLEKDDKTKEYEANSKANLDTIKKFFDSMKEIKSESEDLQAVNGYSLEYQEFNSVELASDEGSKESGSPNDTAVDAMKMSDKIFGGLGKFFEEARDDIYVNEYILERFKEYDSSLLNGAISKESTTTGDKTSYNNVSIDDDKILAALALENQEVEYIIYGSTYPGGNLARSFEEIFLIRLAIRTTEGLLKAKGTPLQILAESVAYGITHAINDILQLINGGEVATFSKSLTFGYKDHLRLLLIIHNNELEKLSRTQALIQFNLGHDLKEVPTYVEATTTTSINLWFLPSVFKVINTAGRSSDTVENKSYQITKTAVMAY